MEENQETQGREVLTKHLEDILFLYKNLHDSKQAYDNAKNRLISVKEALSKRRTALRGREGRIAYLFVLSCFVTIAGIVWLFGCHSLLTLVVTVVLLPYVVFLGIRRGYEKKVVPQYIKRTQDVLSSAEDDYMTEYENLMKKLRCFELLTFGLESRFSPLSTYIMLQATIEGECYTVGQCVLYYESRYKTLVEDINKRPEERMIENAEELKNQLDKEADEAEEFIDFIKGLVADMIEVMNKDGINTETK